jgi:hypothetical protein
MKFSLFYADIIKEIRARRPPGRSMLVTLSLWLRQIKVEILKPHKNWAFAPAGPMTGTRSYAFEVYRPPVIQRSPLTPEGPGGTAGPPPPTVIRGLDETNPELIERQRNNINRLLNLLEPKKWHRAVIFALYLIPPLGFTVHMLYLGIRGALQNRFYDQINIKNAEAREGFAYALSKYDRPQIDRILHPFSPEAKAAINKLVDAVSFIRKYGDPEFDLHEASAEVNRIAKMKIESQNIQETLIAIGNELLLKTKAYYRAALVLLIGKNYDQPDSADAKKDNLGILISALKNPLLPAEERISVGAEAERLAAGLGLLLKGNPAAGQKNYILFPYLPGPGKRKGTIFDEAELLGKGSVGEVYKALDMQKGEARAIKIFKISDATAHREIDIMVSLMAIKNEHLMTIFDCGETREGNLFSVLPLMEKLTLRKMIEDNREDGRTFDPVKAAEYTLQMLDGLKALHDDFLAHRDLKPANVFVMITAEGDLVIIADFDQTKDIAGSKTGPEGQRITEDMPDLAPLIGTYRYLAPEYSVFSYLEKQGVLKEKAEKMDWLVKNDIYSMGVILYMMLTNRDPFNIGNDINISVDRYARYAVNANEHIEKMNDLIARGLAGHEIADKLIKGKKGKAPKPAREGIPRALFKIIAKAIAYDPNDRYQSTDDFIADICLYLASAKKR